MTGDPTEATATGILLAMEADDTPADPDRQGAPRAVVLRQELRVTGPAAAAGAVVGLLALAPEVAADVLAREEQAVRGRVAVVDEPPLQVTLAPTHDPDVVVARGPFDARPRQRPVSVLGDGVVSTLTRARLDAGGAAPRVHGAALADAEQRTVVLVGASGAGKSTLTAWLAASGLDLLNDEQLVVLRGTERIGAFTRPVSVKRGSLGHLPDGVVPRGAEIDAPRMLVTAAELGSRHRLSGRPVLIVVPARRDDHDGAPAWEQLPPADVVSELCAHNLDLVRDPPSALDAFAWLAATVPTVRLRYRDAADAVPVVRSLLADPPALDDVAWGVEVEPDGGTSDIAGASTRMVPDGPAGGDRCASGPDTAVEVARAPTVVTVAIGDQAVLFEPAGRGVAVLGAADAAEWTSLPWASGSDRGAGGGIVPALVADLGERGFVALGGRAATSFRRAPGLVSRLLRGTVVVSRLDHQIIRLDGVAAAVWEALAAPGRADQVVRRLGPLATRASGPAAATGGTDDRPTDPPGGEGSEAPPDGDVGAADGWDETATAVAAALTLLLDEELVQPGPGVEVAAGPASGDADVGRAMHERDGALLLPAESTDGATSPVGDRPRPVPGSVEGVLARVAGWHLPGAPAVEPLANPADADLLVDRATTTRLLGPLVVAVDAGALDLPGPALERAVARHEEALLWCLHLEVRLLEVHEWFADAGVPFLLTKGAAVAHLDDLDPSLRSFADLDLLVPGLHMDRSLEVLEDRGARRAYVERRPGFDRRFVKSVTATSPDGVEVDVHRTLCDGTHGFRIPLDRLHAEAGSFVLGGVEIRTPSRVHRALHAAYHGVLGSAVPPLRTLRDVASYIAGADLPPEVLAAEAGRWRGEAVLAEAVRAAFDAFELDAPAWAAWLDEVEVDPREAEIVARQRVESGSFGRAKLTALRELAWRDRAAFAAAVALPSASHLRSRRVRRRDVVRTAARRARGLWVRDRGRR